MRDHHALRHTCRSRGVDQIRRIVQRRHRPRCSRLRCFRPRCFRPRCFRTRHSLGSDKVRFVERDPVHRGPGLGQYVDVLRRRHPYRDNGIRQHVRKAIRRVRRVDRYERTAGLGHCPHGNHVLHRAPQSDCHERTDTDAACDQQLGHCSRPRIQLSVGHRCTRTRNHQCLGTHPRSLHRGGEDLRQQLSAHRRRTANRDQGSPLGGRQNIDVADRTGRIGGRAAQQRHEPVEMRLRSAVVRFRVMDEPNRHTGGNAERIERLVHGDHDVDHIEIFAQVLDSERQKHADQVRFRGPRRVDRRTDRLQRCARVSQCSRIDVTQPSTEIGERLRCVDRRPEDDDVAVGRSRTHADRDVGFVGES